jgi:hypothetical protein
MWVKKMEWGTTGFRRKLLSYSDIAIISISPFYIILSNKVALSVV